MLRFSITKNGINAGYEYIRKCFVRHDVGLLSLSNIKCAFQDHCRASLESDNIYYILSQLNIQAPKMRKLPQ